MDTFLCTLGEAEPVGRGGDVRGDRERSPTRLKGQLETTVGSRNCREYFTCVYYVTITCVSCDYHVTVLYFGMMYAGLLRQVATGNWGCGAYGGDPQLKSMLQWAAASSAGRPEVIYFPFSDKRMEQVHFDPILQRNLHCLSTYFHFTVGGGHIPSSHKAVDCWPTAVSHHRFLSPQQRREAAEEPLCSSPESVGQVS